MQKPRAATWSSRLSDRKVKYWPFRGGLDLVTPPITIPEGMMIAGRNFEPWIDGGYRRVLGYERFDGQPAPSDATYTSITLDAALGTAVEGDPFLSDVKSLLNFAGMADGTTITDFVAGNTWTVGGDAAIASGELVMDGTGDSLAHTHSAAFRDAFNGVTTDQWTIEYRVEIDQVIAAAIHIDWRTAYDNKGLVISQATADENKITVQLGDGTVGFDATLQSTSTFIAGAVVDVAVTRNGTAYYLHINGVYEDTATLGATLDLGDAGMLIGIGRDASSQPFEGDWRRMRFTSGSARYSLSTNYTVETGESYFEVQAVGALVGDSLLGDTSGATGEVIGFSADLTKVHVTKVTGTWIIAESVLNTDNHMLDLGTSTVVASESADTVDEEAAFKEIAEDVYRVDIQQVPGEGPIRGIWQIKEHVFAIRDNIGQTAGIIHEATAAGWVSNTDMTSYIYFTAGSDSPGPEPAIGDTLEGNTSGASATIVHIIVHSGDWSTNDAAGYYALDTSTITGGPFQAAENLKIGTSTVGIATAAETLFSLPPGGRYDFVSANFYAGTETYSVYAANGVGPAFEIAPENVGGTHEVIPILMDLTLGDSPEENKPHLVEFWDGKLWLAFTGGTVQSSIAGDPHTFNGFLGAAEYGLSEEVTSLQAMSGDVMIARTRRHTHAFYKGTTYTKKIISERSGGILWSNQEIDDGYAMDDQGITSLRRVDTFGDFANSTVSDKIQPWLVARKELVAGSMVIRDSNQYRLLYSNGEGAIMRIRPDGVTEFGVIDMPTTINCAYSMEDENGSPVNFFGGSEGYVFQAERGCSWDGEAIESTARMPFNHQGEPHIRKRYRLAELELEGERSVELYMAADLSYAGTETGAHFWEDRVVGGGGYYDVDNWDQIFWDAQQFTTARFEILGTGKNISLMFFHSSNTTAPFILQGVQLHYDIRRVQR